MKNFVEKTKLQQRHQDLENSDLSPQSKYSRPIFLSNMKSPKFQKNTLTTVTNPWESSQSPTQAQENWIISPKAAHSALETVRTNRYKSLIESRKPMLRRKSCCCQWCGGISNFEEKHQDIESYIKRNDRPSPVNVKPKHFRKHSKTESRPSPPKTRFAVSQGPDSVTSIVDTCISPESPLKNEKRDKDNKKVTVTEPGTKARLSIALEDDDKNSKFSRTMTSYHKHSESSIGSESKIGERLKRVLGGRLNMNIETSQELLELKEKRLEVWRNTFIGLRPKRQNSITPVKLTKNSPFNSNFVSKAESRHLRGESMESLPSMYKINAIPENVSSSPTHKINMTMTNMQVIKNLITNGSKYLPPSEEKIKQLSTPLSLITLDKMRTTIKQDSPLKGMDKERKSPVSKETPTTKSSLAPMKRKSNEDGNSPMLSTSSNNLMLQISDQIKQRYISPKIEIQKLSCILKTAQKKTQNIYIDETSIATLSRRTLSVLKTRSISTKSGIGSHLSTECSPVKGDHSGISFKQAMKDVNRQSKSNFSRSKSNTRVQRRDFDMSTKAQATSGISGSNIKY